MSISERVLVSIHSSIIEAKWKRLKKSFEELTPGEAAIPADSVRSFAFHNPEKARDCFELLAKHKGSGVSMEMGKIVTLDKSLLHRALDVFSTREDEMATSTVYKIGYENCQNKELSLRALKILARRDDRVSCWGYPNIAAASGHFEQALDMIADDPRDISTKRIGRIAVTGKEDRNIVIKALTLLADRNTDEACRQIGEIGRHVDGMAGPAIQILAKREGWCASKEIAALGPYFDKKSSSVLQILGGREDEEAFKHMKVILPKQPAQRVEVIAGLSEAFRSAARPEAKAFVANAVVEILNSASVSDIVKNDGGRDRLERAVHLAADLNPSLSKEKMRRIVDAAINLDNARQQLAM